MFTDFLQTIKKEGLKFFKGKTDCGVWLKRKIAEYGIAIIMAVTVGIISVLPQFLAARALDSEYQGYPFIYIDDEDHYLARIQEIIDGHELVGSPVFYEYKDNVPATFPIIEYAYAFSVIIFGITLTSALVASKFLLPSLLFFLVYWLVRLLVAEQPSKIRELTAIGTALAVIFGHEFIDYKYAAEIIFGNNSDARLSLWTRPVNPISGALTLFGGLIVLWKMFSQPGYKKSIILGIIFALSISYFFTWFMILGCISAASIVALIKKNKNVFYHLISALVLGFILQIPYWYNTFTQTGAGTDFLLRNGMIFTHVPIVNKFVFAITLVIMPFFIYVYVKKIKKPELIPLWWWFVWILVGVSWFAYTQQIITGRTIWPYHFVQYTAPFMIVVFFVSVAQFLSQKIPRLWNLVMVILSIVCLGWGIHTVYTYPYVIADFADRQRYPALFGWVNENTPKDCVVLAVENHDNLARIIPAFTHCNVYTSTYTFFAVPKERVLHNYLVLLRLRGIKPADLLAYLESRPAEVNSYFFVDLPQSLSTKMHPATQESIKEIVAAYKEFYQNDFTSELKKYRLDYIVMDTGVQTYIPKEWKEVQEINKIKIYQIN